MPTYASMTTDLAGNERIRVDESAGIYRATVTHPCGHRYASPSGYNDAAAARKHGRDLLACVCGVCRAPGLDTGPRLPYACPGCEQLSDVPGRCPSCVARDRESQGETVKLFEPAPAQIPGQLAL